MGKPPKHTPKPLGQHSKHHVQGKFRVPAAKFGQQFVKLHQSWLNLEQLCPTLAKFGPDLASIGQTWPQVGRTWRPACNRYSKIGPKSMFESLWSASPRTGAAQSNRICFDTCWSIVGSSVQGPRGEDNFGVFGAIWSMPARALPGGSFRATFACISEVSPCTERSMGGLSQHLRERCTGRRRLSQEELQRTCQEREDASKKSSR